MILSFIVLCNIQFLYAIAMAAKQLQEITCYNRVFSAKG